jgi:hypothetical protein
VALRYEFLQEQRPEAFASIGPARLVKSETTQHHRTLLATLTGDLTTELDNLHTDITAERLETFTTVLHGNAGIDRVFDRALRRQQRESRRHTLEDRERERGGQ